MSPRERARAIVGTLRERGLIAAEHREATVGILAASYAAAEMDLLRTLSFHYCPPPEPRPAPQVEEWPSAAVWASDGPTPVTTFDPGQNWWKREP